MHEYLKNLTQPPLTDWQTEFLELLPAIERYARIAFRRLDAEARDEAIQAVVTSAAVAYARLAASAKTGQGYATTLARYGVKQYRAGRLPGGSVNANDVGSARCRTLGCRVEPLDQFHESLCDTRNATPADVAALRVDFSDWYRALSSRDRQVVDALAKGERTSHVATLCKLTAGRVSQLRRELYANWKEFIGGFAAGA